MAVRLALRKSSLFEWREVARIQSVAAPAHFGGKTSAIPIAVSSCSRGGGMNGENDSPMTKVGKRKGSVWG